MKYECCCQPVSDQKDLTSITSLKRGCYIVSTQHYLPQLQMDDLGKVEGVRLNTRPKKHHQPHFLIFGALRLIVVPPPLSLQTWAHTHTHTDSDNSIMTVLATHNGYPGQSSLQHVLRCVLIIHPSPSTELLCCQTVSGSSKLSGKLKIFYIFDHFLHIILHLHSCQHNSSTRVLYSHVKIYIIICFFGLAMAPLKQVAPWAAAYAQGRLCYHAKHGFLHLFNSCSTFLKGCSQIVAHRYWLHFRPPLQQHGEFLLSLQGTGPAPQCLLLSTQTVVKIFDCSGQIRYV